MCSARIAEVQAAQGSDLVTATFIMAVLVDGGQAGGVFEVLVKMTPLPLGKIPAKHV